MGKITYYSKVDASVEAVGAWTGAGGGIEVELEQAGGDHDECLAEFGNVVPRQLADGQTPDSSALVNGVDFNWDSRLDNDSWPDVDIYDTGDSGNMAANKYFRILHDDVNIKTGLGFDTIIAKDSSSVEWEGYPENEHCWVDPNTGKIKFPHLYMHSTMASSGDCTSPTYTAPGTSCVIDDPPNEWTSGYPSIWGQYQGDTSGYVTNYFKYRWHSGESLPEQGMAQIRVYAISSGESIIWQHGIPESTVDNSAEHPNNFGYVPCGSFFGGAHTITAAQTTGGTCVGWGVGMMQWEEGTTLRTRICLLYGSTEKNYYDVTAGWHNLFIVWDENAATKVTVYIDGVSRITETDALPAVSSPQLTLHGGKYFDQHYHWVETEVKGEPVSVKFWHLRRWYANTAMRYIMVWDHVADDSSNFASWVNSRWNQSPQASIYGTANNLDPVDFQTGYYYIGGAGGTTTGLPKPPRSDDAEIIDQDVTDFDHGKGYFGITRKIYKSNYIPLVEGIDYFYGGSLTYDYGVTAADLYDISDSGALGGPQDLFRFVHDGKNIGAASPGLELSINAVDLSTDDNSSQPMVYVDPERGKFIMPRPQYWSKFSSYSNTYETAEVTTHVPSWENDGEYLSAGTHAKFTSDLKWDTEEYETANSEKFYPLGTHNTEGEMLISLWFYMEMTGDREGSFKIVFGDDTYIQFGRNKAGTASNILVVNGSTVDSAATNLGTSMHHLYISFAKAADLTDSKSVRVFIDAAEILSSTVTPNTNNFYLEFINDGVLATNSIQPEIDNLKIWDYVFDESPVWLYNGGTGYENALHKVYGVDTVGTEHYRPRLTSVNSGGVSYYLAAEGKSYVKWSV